MTSNFKKQYIKEKSTLKKLVPLIEILTKQKTSQIEILSDKSKMPSKSRLLFELIKNQKVKNDDEAAQILYKTNSKNPTYRKLKNRLIDRLINTIFFIDVQASRFTPHRKAWRRSMKQWAAANILIDSGQKKAAVSLLETILKSSQKFEIQELSFLILRKLKTHYGLYEYNRRKHKLYSKKYIQLKEEIDLMDELNVIYEHLGHSIETKKSHNYNQEIKEYEKKLKKLKLKIESTNNYELHFRLYNSEYFIEMIKKDTVAQLKIVSAADNFFEKKKGFPGLAEFVFKQFKGISFLNLKKVAEAKETFLALRKFSSRPGSLAWQSTHNYIFFCNILLKDYYAAYDELSLVMNNKGFKKLYEEFKQQWYLKEAYINLLIKIGKIDESKVTSKRNKKFSLGKFLNEVPSLSKDKRGYNLSIQIIQLLFFLVQKKDDLAITKLESLVQYRSRYLKGKENIRASTFIKMLSKIPSGNFRKKHTLRLTQKLEQTLNNNPLDYSDQALTTEIIPYGVLWEQILDHLESKR